MDASLEEKATWVNYSEHRPPVAGIYLWRLPVRRHGGLFVQFTAVMRMRGAGYDSVLSPEFDYWDGWNVIVNPATQWMTMDNPPESKNHRCEIVAVEGIDIAACPFCGKTPTWSGSERGSDGGVWVGSPPSSYNSWRLNCCRFNGSPSYEDPRKLAETWNMNLSKYNKEI